LYFVGYGFRYQEGCGWNASNGVGVFNLKKVLARDQKCDRKEALLNIPFHLVKSPERGGILSRFRAFHFSGVKVNNEWRRRRA